VKKHSGKFSVPPEKFPDYFQTFISNKFLSHARSIYRIYCMRYLALFAFVAFIAFDNAGGVVLGNVIRLDDFERRVLHDVQFLLNARMHATNAISHLLHAIACDCMRQMR
jgi:hypothetical protein